jgi:hypothetical protein
MIAGFKIFPATLTHKTMLLYSLSCDEETFVQFSSFQVISDTDDLKFFSTDAFRLDSLCQSYTIIKTGLCPVELLLLL